MDIEELEEEYNNFECRIDTINCLDELETYIKAIFCDINGNINTLKIDYRNNVRSKRMGYIRNLFPFIFEEEDLSLYDEDNKYIDELFLLNKIYENYFKQIVHHSNDDNYKEMIKLVDFLTICYDGNSEYVYSKRDEIEYRRKGVGYISNCDDNSEAVYDFFTSKLLELSSVKGIEKVNKM